MPPRPQEKQVCACRIGACLNMNLKIHIYIYNICVHAQTLSHSTKFRAKYLYIRTWDGMRRTHEQMVENQCSHASMLLRIRLLIFPYYLIFHIRASLANRCREYIWVASTALSRPMPVRFESRWRWQAALLSVEWRWQLPNNPRCVITPVRMRLLPPHALHTLSHTHTHAHTYTHAHTHTQSHTLSHTHSVSLSHTHTHAHSRALSLSHTHKHSHAHTRSRRLPRGCAWDIPTYATHTHTPHTRARSHTHNQPTTTPRPRLGFTNLCHSYLLTSPNALSSLMASARCDTTQSYAWHDFFIFVTWLVYVACLPLRLPSPNWWYSCSVKFVTLLVFICDITPLYFWHVYLSDFPLLTDGICAVSNLCVSVWLFVMHLCYFLLCIWVTDYCVFECLTIVYTRDLLLCIFLTDYCVCVTSYCVFVWNLIVYLCDLLLCICVTYCCIFVCLTIVHLSALLLCICVTYYCVFVWLTIVYLCEIRLCIWVPYYCVSVWLTIVYLCDLLLCICVTYYCVFVWLTIVHLCDLLWVFVWLPMLLSMVDSCEFLLWGGYD